MINNINKKKVASTQHEDGDAVNYQLQLQASITAKAEINSED